MGKFQTCVALCLLLYILLHSYGYGFICFGYILTVLLLLYSIHYYHGLKFLYPKTLLFFITYFLLLRAFCADSVANKIAPSTTSMFIFLGFFLYNLKDISMCKFLKLYRRIAYINIALLIIQTIIFSTIKYRIIGIIPFFPSTLTDDLSVLEKGD